MLEEGTDGRFALTRNRRSCCAWRGSLPRRRSRPWRCTYDKTGEFPWEIYRKAYDIGLMTPSVPTNYGGGPPRALECCLIVEELGAACAGITTSIMVNDLALMPILVGGSDLQEYTSLTPFCSSFHMGAFCLTEPGAGSDVASMSTTAKLDGDNYSMNGTKTFITNGSVASLYTVFATRDKSLRHQGYLRGPPHRLIHPAFRMARVSYKMGQRASDTAEVIFEDVRKILRQSAESGPRGIQNRHGDAGSYSADDRRHVRRASPRRYGCGYSIRQRNAKLLVCRSAIIRRYSYYSPTWRRTSRPRVC